MEPIAGKLVEESGVPPCELWLATWLSDGVWHGACCISLEEAHQAADPQPSRVFHCSDAPPQLPDREKLAEWLMEHTSAGWRTTADAVLSLLRDGIPAELMPNEK